MTHTAYRLPRRHRAEWSRLWFHVERRLQAERHKSRKFLQGYFEQLTKAAIMRRHRFEQEALAAEAEAQAILDCLDIPAAQRAGRKGGRTS